MMTSAMVAQVKRGQLVYDPYVGTGSMLIAAAHFGAIVVGADIDARVIRIGKTDKVGAVLWGTQSGCLSAEKLGLASSKTLCPSPQTSLCCRSAHLRSPAGGETSEPLDELRRLPSGTASWPAARRCTHHAFQARHQAQDVVIRS